MSNLENNNQSNNPLDNTNPQQNVEVETNGQLRIIFDDEHDGKEHYNGVEKKSVESFHGISIHIDEDDEEEGEDPDYTGDYTDFFRK